MVMNTVGDITEIESDNGVDEVVDETDENIEIIFEDLDNSQVAGSFVNNKHSEASCSMSSSNVKRPLVNLPNKTCKKYKSGHIQTSLTSDLENAKHSTGKKDIDFARRRPTVHVKALTSSLVAEKYEVLLGKRLSIASFQDELLKQQVKHQAEEHRFKIQLLKTQLEQQSEEHKLKVEALKLDIAIKKRNLENKY
ncbi:hypothetical protein RN001_012371 [Aquatica leii]|uniref:Uncharacterized protein n=1 Tax=Aquatica leii TaxID=1421715 RepID=A0AAN7P2Y3_9COLE|nr:hypothetical protein RN001_012371 [Aquatica leii]